MSITLADAIAFSTLTAQEIAELAARTAKAYLLANNGSRTLAASMKAEVRGVGFARVLVPHYWALYVHDGRGPVEMPAGRFMVFFPDTQNDPRTDFGSRFPVRLSDIEHLSRQQFIEGLEQNRERREFGGQPFMIVTRSVGPIPGVPFFREGLANLDVLAGKIAQERFRNFMAIQIGGLSFRGGVSGSLG